MSKASFNQEAFTGEHARGLACMVAGLNGQISDFQTAVRGLAAVGFDTVVYEHGDAVYKNGEAEQMPALIDAIQADFEDRAASYQRKLYAGVSAGSLVAFNLQQRAEGVQRGLYATGGVPTSEFIFHSVFSRVFGFQRAFKRNGYTEESLREAWKDIDASVDRPPELDKPFLVVLGQKDRIVKHSRAMQTYDAWLAAGVPVEVVTEPGRDHDEAIEVFKGNIGKLFAQVNQIPVLLQ